MDLVRCSRKAVKLNHSLTHSPTLPLPHPSFLSNPAIAPSITPHQPCHWPIHHSSPTLPLTHPSLLINPAIDPSITPHQPCHCPIHHSSPTLPLSHPSFLAIDPSIIPHQPCHCPIHHCSPTLPLLHPSFLTNPTIAPSITAHQPCHCPIHHSSSTPPLPHPSSPWECCHFPILHFLLTTIVSSPSIITTVIASWRPCKHHHHPINHTSPDQSLTQYHHCNTVALYFIACWHNDSPPQHQILLLVALYIHK